MSRLKPQLVLVMLIPVAAIGAAAGSDSSLRHAVAQAGATASVKEAVPVIVQTLPAAGDTQVDAAKVTEIRVTYSKDMKDGSWSWSQVSKDSFPATTGKPFFDKDKRTCVLPVKLEPGRAYVIWLNPEKFQGFRDADGRPAVFYPLVFETKR